MSVSTFTMGGQRLKLKPDTIDWSALDRLRSNEYSGISRMLLDLPELPELPKESQTVAHAQPSAWTYQFTDGLVPKPTVEPPKPASPFPAHVTVRNGWSILGHPKWRWVLRPSKEFLQTGLGAPMHISGDGVELDVYDLIVGNDGVTQFVANSGRSCGVQTGKAGVYQTTTSSLAFKLV